MAGHADAGGVDEGHAAERQNALVHAVRRKDEEVGCDLGITVVGLVDGQHDEAAAGEFDVVGVSHLLVVQVAVAGDDRGGGIVLRGRLGDEQIGGHRVAAVRFDVQLLHDDLAARGLHRADDDAAQQHQHQRQAQAQLGCFLDFFHNSAPLFLFETVLGYRDQYRTNTYPRQVFTFHKKEYAFLWNLTETKGIAPSPGL